MHINWFDQIGLADRATVGGKGASLGELTRTGVRVPPGFVVTTKAFEVALSALDGDGTIRQRIAELTAGDLEEIGRVTAEVRRRIERAPLPAEIHSAIRDAYQQLCPEGTETAVAVRSSATSEDGDDASFAGLQDTYLWVRGLDDVLKSVRSCWASLYSVESVSYRLRLKMPEDHVAMGVVVQRMVSSRSSGVMFTRSPTTGDRSVIAIEGSWGLGSCIVSGEVTPDRFVVSKVTGDIVKRTISSKPVQHVPDAERGGVRSEPVPEEKQNAPCLTDAEIRELGQLAKQVERHYGAPQDIEWSIGPAGDGEHVYLLQSRPETAWTSRETEPLATPKPRAFDHVLAVLGGRQR